jgi:hypothetical protein
MNSKSAFLMLKESGRTGHNYIAVRFSGAKTRRFATAIHHIPPGLPASLRYSAWLARELACA